MQVTTCMSSSATVYVPRDCSLEAVPRYRRALRQDRRGLAGRCALGGIRRLAQLMTGPRARFRHAPCRALPSLSDAPIPRQAFSARFGYPCRVAGAVSGRVNAWQVSPSIAPTAFVGRGLSLRCTRPATVGFARLRGRVNRDVRGHTIAPTYMDSTTLRARKSDYRYWSMSCPKSASVFIRGIRVLLPQTGVVVFEEERELSVALKNLYERFAVAEANPEETRTWVFRVPAGDFALAKLEPAFREREDTFLHSWGYVGDAFVFTWGDAFTGEDAGPIVTPTVPAEIMARCAQRMGATCKLETNTTFHFGVDPL